MRITLLLLVCFGTMLTNKDCGSGQRPPNVNGTVVTAPSPSPETTPQPPDPPGRCEAISVYLYEDDSGSVDAAHRRAVKESFVAQLKQNRDSCISVIKTMRFGVRSVWSTPAQVFRLPLRPKCAAEPDYDHLPPSVRNFEPWREKLRQEYKAGCESAESNFRVEYDAAIAAFAKGFLVETRDQSNQCTSFANLIERMRVDLVGDPSGRIVLISDLAWSCHEAAAIPVHVTGVMIRIIGEQQDDRYHYSEDSAASVMKALPECVIVPEVKADEALSMMTAQPKLMNAKFAFSKNP